MRIERFLFSRVACCNFCAGYFFWQPAAPRALSMTAGRLTLCFPFFFVSFVFVFLPTSNQTISACSTCSMRTMRLTAFVRP
jgi:hypothetical protein